MRSSRRIGVAILFTLGLGLAGCSGAGAPALGCSSDAQCPAASRCVQQACVADAPPVARFDAPASPVEAFALVALDGSQSSDADSGDAVVSFTWTVRALSAPCAPPVIAGASAAVQVRFACAGRFALDLVVTDQLGVQGATRTVEVDVADPSGPSRVVVSGDVAVDHDCSGDPVVCRSVSVPLFAAAPGLSDIQFQWTVQPPANLALGADRRAVFEPSSFVPAPNVTLETDGGAISGDWVVRVEARDAVGVIGVASKRVSVLNRAPVITGTGAGPWPHAFDAGSAQPRFVSEGLIPVTIVDPDGDPLDPVQVTWRHVGDGGASFSGAILPEGVSFRVEVSYAAPEDAQLLIGAAGLQRSVELFVRDVNGGAGTMTFPIEIQNLPPSSTGPGGTLTVPHGFDAVSARYVASAALPAWTDPEGDPLFVGGGTGSGPCTTVRLSGASPVIECAVVFDGTPRANELTGAWPVQVKVQDPWAEPVDAPTYTVNVLNRGPLVTASTSPTSVTCTRGACCDRDEITGVCLAYNWSFPATDFSASTAVSDPDGDPIVVNAIAGVGGSVTPASATCSPGACASFAFHQPALPPACGGGGSDSGRLVATDGLALAEVDMPGCP